MTRFRPVSPTSLCPIASGETNCRNGTQKKLLSLPLFPFVRVEVLPTTSSPPHLIVFSTLLFLQSSSSPAFLTSLLTQSSHLSLGLPCLLLPCSHNSATLFGSLSSAIISTCPAHCSTSAPHQSLCQAPLHSCLFP